MQGDITIDGGDVQIRAYEARPAAAPPCPGLVLVPDVHGLREHYRDVARRYAEAGFWTVAVDLYTREGTPVLGDAAAVARWIRALPDRRVCADLAAAVTYLEGVPAVGRGAVGITGYCMGGQYALLAACRDARLRACVAWYGMLRYAVRDADNPAAPLDVAAQLRCPLLGLYGEEDALIPLADVDALRAVLEETGVPFDVRTYPGAGHAFFNDTRPEAYRPAAAADAWARAVAFLHRHLG